MFVVAAVIVGVVELEGKGKTLAGHTTSTTRDQLTTTTAPPVPPPPVKSALAPWDAPLPVAINEALVMPGPSAKLLIIGGEVSNGTSGIGAFLMNTSTGALEQVVNLAAAVHDASGATLGDQDYVFGGKGTAVTSSVQSFPSPSSPSTSVSTAAGSPSTTTAAPSVVTATATGALPEPRAGSVAVTIGSTVYIVGGYHAGKAEASVLSTSDGGTFTTVAQLPVPVRNAAVAVAGGDIYVFGGAEPATVAAGPTTSAGPGAPTTARGTTAAGSTTSAAVTWRAVADIQRIDPVTGQATVVGQLPTALQGAVAVTLDGKIYVAGGAGPAVVNGLIWGFEPPDAGLALAGHLKVPVSGPGVTTIGATAWLVGGEAAGGHLVGSIQTFRPNLSSVPSPGPGSSPQTTTTKTSPVPTG